MINTPAPISPQKTLPADRPHLTYLDGIRGLAAFFVVFGHVWQGPFGRNAHAGITGFFTNWALYGHIAVDVFIVVSGFCLVLPVAKKGVLTGGIRGFYKRRAHRILPPFYFALMVALPINFLIHKSGSHPLVSGKALLANLFLLQDWFPDLNVLDGPLWSVAVEWKIYFLFPLLIWIWQRFSMAWTLVAASVIGYSATLVFHLLQPGVSMGNTCPWYVFLFAIGVSTGAAAVRGGPVLPGLRLRWVFLASFLVSVGLLVKYPITTEGEQVLYVPHLVLIDPAVGVLAGTTLLLLYRSTQQHGDNWGLKLTTWRPLVFLGTFAYSLYLVHLPHHWIIAGGLHRIPILKSSPGLTAAFLLFVAIPFVGCLSYLFFLICERPFLNRRNNS